MELYHQKIIDIKDETPSIRTFFFDVPEGLTWAEGAHLHIAFPDFNAGGKRDPDKIRHMSIASLPRENVIAITTRLNGSSPFKDGLARLQVGDEMILFKFGSRLALRRERRPVCLLAMGIGLAAFRPLLLEFADDPAGIPSLTSLTRCRPDQELYQSELSPLNSTSLSHQWIHTQADFLQAAAQTPDDAIFYIVGSEIFIRDLIYFLRAKGVRDEDMVIDKKPQIRTMFFQTMDLITEKPLLF